MAKRKQSGLLKALVALLAVALLVSVIPGLYRGGSSHTEAPGATHDCIHVQLEPTQTIKEEQPPEELAPYVVLFASVEEYWRLREAVDLPDEELYHYLRNNHYRHMGDFAVWNKLPPENPCKRYCSYHKHYTYDGNDALDKGEQVHNYAA